MSDNHIDTLRSKVRLALLGQVYLGELMWDNVPNHVRQQPDSHVHWGVQAAAWCPVQRTPEPGQTYWSW